MKVQKKLNLVLQYTQCIDIWLSDKGEYKILEDYENYVKSMLIEKKYNQIKTLSEWLSETNLELFCEYDQYINNTNQEKLFFK